MKGAAATGVTVTGITAFSGSAAAQDQDPTEFVTVADPKNGHHAQQGSTVTIEHGKQNACFQELNIEIDEKRSEYTLNKDDGTAEGTLCGTVTGSVLPDENADPNDAKEINTTFEGVSFEAEVGGTDNPDSQVVELIRLEIPDLFLNLLGLLVTLDLFLLVEADPEGGLLGQLLAALLGP